MTEIAESPAVQRLYSRAALSRAVSVQTLPYLMVPVMFLLLVLTIDGFVSKSSIVSLLILSSLLGLASLGQTMTIITGGVDLSIPSVIGLAEIIITQKYADGWSLATIFLVLIGLSVVIGVINALAPVLLRVPALITTLGTGFVVQGVALAGSHGFTQGKVPAWLETTVSPIGHTWFIPLPGIVVAWVILAIVTICFLRFTRIGREGFANGANPLAAKLAGVRSTWVLIVVFTISALCASLVGVFFAGYSGLPDANVGQPYFFETITAVVIGGTSLLGGGGSYARTVVGALIVAQLTTLLVGINFGVSAQEMFLGIGIVLLATIYGRQPDISTRI